MSSREDNGAEGPRRKRGDSGGEHGRIIKEADAIRKHQDHNDEIKRLATELFEHAHIEDSDLSLLKLSLDAIKTAVKSEHEAEVLRAEMRRNNFLLEAGDWFAGVINGLKRFKKKLRPKAQEELRAQLKADGKSAAQADALIKKSCNWEACRSRGTGEMVALLKEEMTKVQDFRKRGEPAGQAPETPVLDRFEKLCAEADISFDNLRKYADLYNERNEVAHSGRPALEAYQVEKKNSDGTLEKSIDWSSILADVERRIADFEKKWKTGQIDEEQFHIAEQCLRDWFKMRATAEKPLGHYTAWRETECAKSERKELEDRAKSNSKGGHSPPASPYRRGKWDKILPA